MRPNLFSLAMMMAMMMMMMMDKGKEKKQKREANWSPRATCLRYSGLKFDSRDHMGRGGGLVVSYDIPRFGLVVTL